MKTYKIFQRLSLFLLILSLGCMLNIIIMNLNFFKNESSGDFLKDLKNSNEPLYLNNEYGNNLRENQANVYYIEVFRGEIDVSVTTGWDMDLVLTVANDLLFLDVLAESDNPGYKVDENVQVYIDRARTIYIKVHCKAGSGFYDIIVTGQEGEVDSEVLELNYYKKWSYSYGENASFNSFRIYPDLNGDGYDDIIVCTNNVNSSVLNLTALTNQGDIIWQTNNFTLGLRTYDGRILGSNGYLSWYLPNIYDENGDGTMDIIGNFNNNNLGILNGKNGSILWEGAPFGRYNYPQALLKDFTGDNKPEILIKNNREFGVLSSNDKRIIWSNTYDNTPNLHVIPDVNNDGIWDIITGANQVSRIDCWSGANGTKIWTKSIGFDSQGESICPDQNNDGYFDILVTPQGSEYELISGKDGESIHKFGYSKTNSPSYYINNMNIGVTMHNDEGIVRSYYLSNGTSLGVIEGCKPDQFNNFFLVSKYNQTIFQLIFLEDMSTAIYALGYYDYPVQQITGNWLDVSPYYGNHSSHFHDLILSSETQLEYYSDPNTESNNLDEEKLAPLVLNQEIQYRHCYENEANYYYIHLEEGKYVVRIKPYGFVDWEILCSYDLDFSIIENISNNSEFDIEEELKLELNEEKTVYIKVYPIKGDYYDGYYSIIVSPAPLEIDWGVVGIIVLILCCIFVFVSFMYLNYRYHWHF